MRDNSDRPVRRGIVSEYVYFLRRYKMWWLLPTIVLIAALGGLVVLAGGKGALAIYALF